MMKRTYKHISEQRFITLMLVRTHKTIEISLQPLLLSQRNYLQETDKTSSRRLIEMQIQRFGVWEIKI